MIISRENDTLLHGVFFLEKCIYIYLNYTTKN